MMVSLKSPNFANQLGQSDWAVFVGTTCTTSVIETIPIEISGTSAGTILLAQFWCHNSGARNVTAKVPASARFLYSNRLIISQMPIKLIKTGGEEHLSKLIDRHAGHFDIKDLYAFQTFKKRNFKELETHTGGTKTTKNVLNVPILGVLMYRTLLYFRKPWRSKWFYIFFK